MYILYIFIWLHQLFFVHTFFSLHLPEKVTVHVPRQAQDNPDTVTICTSGVSYCR